jgi:RNA polymerase sigma factor (sigma-70 family)
MTDENQAGIREQWKRELEAVFQENYPAIYKAVCASLGTSQDVDDILQDVFLSLLKGQPVKDFRKNPRGYLFQSAMNRARNLHRSRKRKRLIDQPIEDLKTAAGSGRDPRIGPLREALAQMDEDDVALLYLAYVEECPCGEIAKIRGTTLANVYVKLFRAKAQVKRLMGYQENESETQKTKTERRDTTGLTEAFE